MIESTKMQNPETQDDDAIEVLHLKVEFKQGGLRLDKAVAQLAPNFSRTRLQNLIEAGECLVGGVVVTTPSRKVEEGEDIVIAIPLSEEAEPIPENIPLDVIYEDDDLLVINKAAGMVVHPAVGHHTGTLVNALLYHCGDSLSGINGVKRPGIVHRLDKETSGLMLVAKNDLAHHHLSEQLQDHSLTRVYYALVLGVPIPVKGRVVTMIGRHPTNRMKMAVLQYPGKEAITNYQVREVYRESFALVECRLETGRTHQIRVHMESLKYQIVGDPLYGPQQSALRGKMKKAGYEDEAAEVILNFPRQALHAAEIAFIHPRTEEEMHFEIDLPDDFQELLDVL